MKYPVAKPVFHGNERKYLLEAFDSSWISSTGRFINKLEEEFAKFCGTDYALTCSNGTTALHLALLALDIGPGDEVIVPTFTFVSTANAVRYCGAKPVFVDCRSDTWNIDEKQIEQAVTDKTKAVIVVHLYGHPCEMEPIWEIADKYGLKIIEDAAEAHGAAYFSNNRTHADKRQEYTQLDGRKRAYKVGNLGDIATFSLYGNKIVTSGEGGLITLNDEKLFKKMVMLRGQGLDPEKRYWFPVIGYNYRLTNLQAAIALAQLEDIDWHLEKRRRIADTYNYYLADSEFINIPVERDDVKHAYWMYSIILSEHCHLTRDEVMEQLGEAGIETRPFFYPMHQLPPYNDKENAIREFPVADKISSLGLNLPTSSAFSENDIRQISNALLEVVSGCLSVS